MRPDPDLGALVEEIRARALAERARGHDERARGMEEAAGMVADRIEED